MLAARLPPKFHPVTVCPVFARIGVAVMTWPHKVWSEVQPEETIVKEIWKPAVALEPVYFGVKQWVLASLYIGVKVVSCVGNTP